MRHSPFDREVEASDTSIQDSEPDILGYLDQEKARAEINAIHADNRDKETLTQLKFFLPLFIFALMIYWFVFINHFVGRYFRQLENMNQEIPSEVVVSIIAAGSALIGLMSHILKGLVNSTQKQLAKSFNFSLPPQSLHSPPQPRLRLVHPVS